MPRDEFTYVELTWIEIETQLHVIYRSSWKQLEIDFEKCFKWKLPAVEMEELAEGLAKDSNFKARYVGWLRSPDWKADQDTSDALIRKYKQTTTGEERKKMLEKVNEGLNGGQWPALPFGRQQATMTSSQTLSAKACSLGPRASPRTNFWGMNGKDETSTKESGPGA